MNTKQQSLLLTTYQMLVAGMNDNDTIDNVVSAYSNSANEPFFIIIGHSDEKINVVVMQGLRYAPITLGDAIHPVIEYIESSPDLKVTQILGYLEDNYTLSELDEYDGEGWSDVNNVVADLFDVFAYEMQE